MIKNRQRLKHGRIKKYEKIFEDCTDEGLLYDADKLLYLYHPDIVFFQIGSNDYVDLKGTDGENVTACMEYKKQMFHEILEQIPNAKLVVMSGLLLPVRSEYRELTEQISSL